MLLSTFLDISTYGFDEQKVIFIANTVSLKINILLQTEKEKDLFSIFKTC